MPRLVLVRCGRDGGRWGRWKGDGCWGMEWERLGKVAVPRLPPGGSVC